MVFRKYRKSGKRKSGYGKSRRYKRKMRRNYIKKSTLSKSVSLSGGFPDVYRCKHRYNDYYTTGSVAVGNYTWVYYRGTPYDPEFTASSGQVNMTYFDNLSQIYSRYRVLGAKMVVTFNVPNQTAPESYLCCVHPYGNKQIDETTMTGTYSPERVLQWVRSKGGLANSQRPKTVSIYLSPNQLFNHSKFAIRTNDNYASAETASVTSSNNYPLNCIMFAVGIQNVTGNGQPIVGTMDIKMTVYVEWFSRRQSPDVFTSSAPSVDG